MYVGSVTAKYLISTPRNSRRGPRAKTRCVCFLSSIWIDHVQFGSEPPSPSRGSMENSRDGRSNRHFLAGGTGPTQSFASGAVPRLSLPGSATCPIVPPINPPIRPPHKYSGHGTATEGMPAAATSSGSRPEVFHSVCRIENCTDMAVYTYQGDVHPTYCRRHQPVGHSDEGSQVWKRSQAVYPHPSKKIFLDFFCNWAFMRAVAQGRTKTTSHSSRRFCTVKAYL